MIKYFYCLFLILFMLPSLLIAQDVGCDETVFEQAENRTNALQQQEVEAAKAVITQPTPVEQATCFDQHTEVIKAATQEHSNPDGDNTSIATLVQQPLQQTMQQFMSGNLSGSIQSMVNNEFNNLVSSFTNGLGLGGGAPTTNCDMQEEAWLISQCIEMPELPSLSSLVGDRLSQLSGSFSNISTLPERSIEAVCKNMSNTLGNYMADVNGAINAVVQDASQPLSDAASAIP